MLSIGVMWNSEVYEVLIIVWFMLMKVVLLLCLLICRWFSCRCNVNGLKCIVFSVIGWESVVLVCFLICLCRIGGVVKKLSRLNSISSVVVISRLW